MTNFRLICGSTILAYGMLFPLSVHGFTDTVSTAAELSASINRYNLELSGDHFIVLAADITLTNQLASISNRAANTTLTIEGDGFIINGASAHSLFVIEEGSTVTIKNLLIEDSKDVNSSAISLLDNATLNFERSEAFNNSTTAGFAGAIHVGSAGATLNVVDSTFVSNTAGTDGGAIYNRGTTSVWGSTFTGNTAGSGGGNGGGAIWSDNLLTIRGSTFCDNVSFTDGGAIFGQDVSSSIVNIEFSTLASNSAPDGAGGNVHADSTLGELNIDSIILSDGSCKGAVDTEIGTSIVPSAMAADTCGLSAGATIVAPDPMLGPLANYGGQTATLALLSGSPAIDQVTTNAANTTDQRGIPRPSDATSDIGAFEFIQADQFEDNDSLGTATQLQAPVNATGLSIDDSRNNDLDWYEFDLKAGDTVTISLFFSHDLGDIDMELVYPAVDLEPIATGESVTDNEVIEFIPSVSGTYNLRVYGFDAELSDDPDNPRNLYDLDIGIMESEICFPIKAKNGKVAVICL